MTDKGFSAASWANYCNKVANKQASDENKAVKTFVEKTVKQLGYPNKDEAHDIIQNFNDYDLTPIAEVVPGIVSGYMQTEGRSFNLPEASKTGTTAKIGIRHVDEKTRTGIVQMGDKKGQTYTSTVSAHEEYFVKNFTKAFKK
jgi:hypothetical protein